MRPSPITAVRIPGFSLVGDYRVCAIKQPVSVALARGATRNVALRHDKTSAAEAEKERRTRARRATAAQTTQRERRIPELPPLLRAFRCVNTRSATGKHAATG